MWWRSRRPVNPCPPRRGCEGPDREAVLVHISFTGYELSDIFTSAFVDVPDTISGPVEPD